MLLNIYLGTTAISYIVIPTFVGLYTQRLKKEGYIGRKKSRTILEKITNFMSDICVVSMPGLNILVSLILLMDTDKCYEKVKKSLLEKGDIYKSTDNIITEEKTENKKDKDIFIEGIEKTMRHVAELKYSGYENDLIELYNQAEGYLKEKRNRQTTKASEVLSPDWFEHLVKIEQKISKKAKLKTDQDKIIEELKQMKELLTNEGITLKDQTSEEETGYTPTLRF